MILGHAGRDALKHGVAPHAHAICNKHVLGASVGRITREFPEGTLWLADARENLSFDDDFCACWNLDLAYATGCDTVGFTEQAPYDLEFAHIGRIGIDHGPHIVQWM